MSAMLSLLFADADERPSEVDITIHNESTYLEARCVVVRALEAGNPIRVAICGTRLQTWVADLAALDESVVERVGVRAELAGRWGRPVPEGLGAEEIRMHRLDKAEVAPGSPLVPALLSHVLGEAWADAIPGAQHLARLLAPPPQVPKTPWIQSARARRLEEWIQEAGGLAAAYRAFRDEPERFREAAARLAAAAGVPRDVRVSLTGEAGHDPAAIQHAAGALSVLPQAAALIRSQRRALGPAVRSYWATRFRKDSRSLVEQLDEVVNPSIETLEALVAEVKRPHSPSRLSQEDLNAVRRVLGGIEGASMLLVQLESHVVPEPPPPPTETDAVALAPWKPWLERYLPYRAALDRLGGEEDELNALNSLAEDFSDWLTGHYSLLLRQGDDLVTSVHHTVRTQLGVGRVVWVVWDNLPAHHADPLVRELGASELFLTKDPEWRLALLPSVTKVSFPALLAGRLVKFGEGTNDKTRTALLESTFKGHTVRFRNTMRGLNELAQDPADLSVIHFINYDALLHKPEYQLEEDTREHELRLLRERTVEKLRDLLAAFPQDRPVRLVITSDHGSTRLPEGMAAKVPLPEGGEESVETYSSRAILIDPSAPSSADVCTRLEPVNTGLDRPVLLARGFRSWSTPRSGAGYVHGGALPEEVLVPLLVVGREHTPMMSIRLGLGSDDPLYVGAEGTLQVHLRNPNGQDARRVRVAVEIDGEERAAAVLQTPLYAESTDALGIPFTPRTDDVRDGACAATLVLRAELLGRPCDERVPVRIPVRSALRSRQDDDLFDF